MRTASVALALSAVATVAGAQSLWVGPAGGGLVTVQEAYILEPGHFAFGAVEDNYDRNHPLGIDVVDIRVDTRMAIVSGLELYTRFHISRAVSVPGTQPAPPSPLDVIVLQGALEPRPPYRGVYWPMPYLGDYPASVTDMVPGEYTFGLKGRVRGQRGWVPAVSVSAQVTLPGDMSSYALAKGSGSGSADVGLHGAASWRYRRLTASLNAGYTLNGGMERTDRIVLTDRSPAVILNVSGNRPDFLHAGIGARLRVWRGISVLGEYSGWAPAGSRTPSWDDGPATDLVGGAQFMCRGLALTVAVRKHLNVPRDGQALSAGPLGAGLDLSALSDVQRREYLQSIGVDQGLHRHGANLVVLGGPEQFVPDPDGSRRIPQFRQYHTTGNAGIIASLSFSF